VLRAPRIGCFRGEQGRGDRGAPADGEALYVAGFWPVLGLAVSFVAPPARKCRGEDSNL